MLPPIEAIKNFVLMTQLLSSSWGVPTRQIDDAQCYLFELSQAIAYYSENKNQQLTFLTISAQESKFSFDHPNEEPSVNPKSGACGPYQIVPRWAVPKDLPADCNELHDPYDGTWRLKEALAAIRKMVKPKNVMCYYATGKLDCTHEKTPYSRAHSKLKAKISRERAKVDKLNPYTLHFIKLRLRHKCGQERSEPLR